MIAGTDEWLRGTGADAGGASGLGRSNQGRRQHWGLDQPGLEHPLARRAVKQDRVAVGFPDRRELDAPRPVQAEENAARPLAADQDPLADFKSSGLQLILVADRLVHVVAE